MILLSIILSLIIQHCEEFNISFGLPLRVKMNAAFLTMLIYAGLNAAIMNPFDEEMIDAIKAAEAIVGKDDFCMGYTRHFKKKAGGAK